MAIADEKERLAREIDAYIERKHDNDKMVIAKTCRAAVQLALNYRELLPALEAYREELLRLVGKKNQRRWFKHKPGELDAILERAIERIRPFATNEAKVFSPPSKPDTSTTIKDWNRHNEGKVWFVNGRAFDQTLESIDELAEFLRKAGIFSARIREYLCDYANQNNLFAGGHIFSGACLERGELLINYSGGKHIYRNGAAVGRLHCRDEAFFDGARSISSGQYTPFDPPLSFVLEYDLLEKSGEVHVVEARYSIENLDNLPREEREVIRNAFAVVSELY